MKYFVLILFIVFQKNVFCQDCYLFNDSIKLNEIAIGDTNKFDLYNNNLKLNAPYESSSAYISFNKNNIINAKWEFNVKMEFNPSSSNYCKIYLVSNKSNLKEELNGYFLMVGNTDDEISLYRQDGNNVTKIIDGVNKKTNSDIVNVSVLVTRDSIGFWQLFVDSTSQKSYTLEGSCLDDIYYSTSYFGVLCIYTSTRCDKFNFSNICISGNPYVDNELPYVKSIEYIDFNNLRISFNEDIKFQSSNNVILNNNIYPISCISDSSDNSKINLLFPVKFNNGNDYTLFLSNFFDYSDNKIKDTTINLKFILPEKAEKNDIVINEILFNPRGNGVDYVELYNRSEKFIDFEKIKIGEWDDYEQKVSDYHDIIETNYILFPGSYIALTNNKINIQSEYGNKGNIYEVNYLPPYNNTEGTVVITSEDSIVLDVFNYNENMHFQLLNDFEGISLEKVNYDISSDENSNWHSASKNCGYGTPGYINSQFLKIKEDNNITIFPETISPNNDGLNDVLNVNLNLGTMGNICSIYIFNTEGQIIKTLVNNELIGVDETFFWDGTNDGNKRLNDGVYIVLTKILSQNGEDNIFKNVCVLVN